VLARAAAVTGAAVSQGQTPKWEALLIPRTKECGFPGLGAVATKEGKKSGPADGALPRSGRRFSCVRAVPSGCTDLSIVGKRLLRGG
jgi:hypothetical protein